MVTVPGFLLRRLYVKKSLKNVSDGFEFQLKNGLGSGYAHRAWPLEVDGEEIPVESCRFVRDEKEVEFSKVSKENTFTLPMNTAITVRVVGTSLAPGPRKVGMAFDVPGLGTLRFDFTDVVENE